MTFMPARDEPRVRTNDLRSRPTGDVRLIDWRALNVAIAGFRAGSAVTILAQNGTLQTIAVETASDALLATRGAGSRLILACGRARALGYDVAGGQPALALDADGLSVATLRALADPTYPGETPPRVPVVELPAGAEGAIELAKRAQLLPAILSLSCTDQAAACAEVMQADLMAGLAQSAHAIERVAEARVPMEEAPDARVVAFRGPDFGSDHLAVLVGQPDNIAPTARAPLVRLHSGCMTGDLFGSLRCDCGPQLRGALARMHTEGSGVLLYLAQEGRGIGIANKLRAYALQDRGLDTVDANRTLGWEADARHFDVAAAILLALGVGRLRLLTNNPAKIAALADYGLQVERVSHLFAPNGVNDRYLATKVGRFGHFAD